MPNYSDSIARNLNEKLGERPSVLDFGAVRDGATDDSAAMQAAIDSVEERGGGVVYLPRGTYAVAAEVELKSGVCLAGEGASSILLRTGNLGVGEALVSVTGNRTGIADLAIDGAVTTAALLKYSEFGLNPMASALTANTSLWVRPGVVGFQLLRARITHTGGYAVLIDADSADVRDVLVDGCTFENNRPHIFRTENNASKFGSWTGGIFYRGDCRASTSKLFAVRGVTVRGCFFRRCTGNQIWGHSWGFDVQHTGVVNTDNYFEVIGRDAILFGNVAGGTASGNTIRRIGYLTETDSDTPVAITGGDFSVGVDTSGFCAAVDYSRNTVTDGPYAEGFDLDGFRDGSLYGNQVSDCFIGVNCGDTQNNGAGKRINFIGNVLEGCTYSSIRLNDCEDCSVVGNTISQPSTATEAPIQMNALTANGVKGNLITGNRIHWDKDSWCVIEAAVGGSYTSAAENRVLNNQISGTNRGEFLKHADSASTSAQILSTTDSSADEPSEGIVERVGFGSGAAIRFANRINGTRTELAQLQDANRMLLVGIAAGSGAVATGNRSSLLWGASPDAMATGKVCADGFGVFVGKDVTAPGWTSTYSDADANLVTTDQVGLIRYNATAKQFEQSVSVAAGVRVWTALGGSITGTANQITVSGGVASLANDGVRIQAATGIANAVLRVRGELAQTVALQEWRKNDETVLAAVDAFGTFFSPAAAFRADTWAPASSATEGRYAAREIRFRQNATSEQADSGVISFRTTDAGALVIAGAGAAIGDRLVSIRDLVTVTGKSLTAAISVTAGFIDSNGGFYTPATTTNAIQAPDGGVTARFFVGTRSFSMLGDTAANAGATTTGNGRIYFDSTANKFKVSESGGAYVDLVGGTLSGLTAGRIPYTTGASSIADSANLTWNNTTRTLGISAQTAATPAIDAVQGYIAAAGGFLSTATNYNSIQCAGGMRTGDGTSGVAGKIYVNFSSLFGNDVGIYGRAISGVNGIHAQNQSGQAAAIMDVYGPAIPAFVGRRANGTIASPSQTLGGDYIMAMGGRGWFSGASDFTANLTCAVLFAASENWTSVAQGSHIEFATTPIGSTSRLPRMTVRGAGQVEIGSAGGTGILGLYGTGTTPAINPNSGYGALSYKSSSTYYYWTGAAWAEFNFAAGSGIESINSQTGSAITIQGTSLEVEVSTASNTITVGLPNSVLISNQLQVNSASGAAILAPSAYIQGRGIISSGLAAWNAIQSIDGGIAASSAYGFSLIDASANFTIDQAIDHSGGGARFVGTGGVFCPNAGVLAAGFNPYANNLQFTGYSSDASGSGNGDTFVFAAIVAGVSRTVTLRFTRGALTFYSAV